MLDHTTKAEMRDALALFVVGVGGIALFGLLVFAACIK